MIQRGDTVELEAEDQCIDCIYYRKEVICPLLEALATSHVVIKAGEMLVQNCGTYSQYKRPLRVV